jgi:hypothetical protein
MGRRVASSSLGPTPQATMGRVGLCWVRYIRSIDSTPNVNVPVQHLGCGPRYRQAGSGRPVHTRPTDPTGSDELASLRLPHSGGRRQRSVAIYGGWARGA